jgi:large subunit ribosomal protein L18e
VEREEILLVYKMKSKSKISKQTEKKTNPILVETISITKKKEDWKRVAEILSGPRRNRVNLSLNQLNEKMGEEVLVVPGKVLSQGDITKKGKIVALDFSERAKEKLKRAGCEFSNIVDEIKKNPEGKKIKILENKEALNK